jgi:uncharacterized protein YggE
MSRNLIVLPLAVLLSLAAAACSGDTVVQSPGAVTGINVNGIGKATGTPDVAVLQIGVEVEAPTVEAARNAAATAQDALIASLKSNGVAEKDIQTQQLSIQPQYDTSRGIAVPPGTIAPPTTTPSGTPVIRAYRVTNTVVIKVRDLSKVSKTLDDAVKAGGNATIVRGISFTIDDTSELMTQAREAAVKDARAHADELAQHAGVSLGKLLSMSESGGAQPLPYLAAPRTGAAADIATPIQPGELEVLVNVNATWAID